MIITITLNPAVDKTVQIDNFTAGSVNRVTSMRLDAGGKGINVSKVISSLGGSSKATGILGGKAGAYIKEYLDSAGIENNFIFVNEETRTNLKIVDSAQGLNTDVNEPGPTISEADMERVSSVILDSIEKDSIAVFSGSVPKGVITDIYKELIQKAKEKGAKTILDADGSLLKNGIEAGPYVLKPNVHELERFLDVKLESLDEVISAAKHIKEKYGIEIVAVSLGEAGAVFLNNDTVIHAKGLKVEVKSTVGAGDSMVAALAHSIEKGYSFEDTVKLAVATATANVMTSGTQSADMDTILQLRELVKFEYLRN